MMVTNFRKNSQNVGRPEEFLVKPDANCQTSCCVCVRREGLEAGIASQRALKTGVFAAPSGANPRPDNLKPECAPECDSLHAKSPGSVVGANESLVDTSKTTSQNQTSVRKTFAEIARDSKKILSKHSTSSKLILGATIDRLEKRWVQLLTARSRMMKVYCQKRDSFLGTKIHFRNPALIHKKLVILESVETDVDWFLRSEKYEVENKRAAKYPVNREQLIQNALQIKEIGNQLSLPLQRAHSFINKAAKIERQQKSARDDLIRWEASELRHIMRIINRKIIGGTAKEEKKISMDKITKAAKNTTALHISAVADANHDTYEAVREMILGPRKLARKHRIDSTTLVHLNGPSDFVRTVLEHEVNGMRRYQTGFTWPSAAGPRPPQIDPTLEPDRELFVRRSFITGECINSLYRNPAAINYLNQTLGDPDVMHPQDGLCGLFNMLYSTCGTKTPRTYADVEPLIANSLNWDKSKKITGLSIDNLLAIATECEIPIAVLTKDMTGEDDIYTFETNANQFAAGTYIPLLIHGSFYERRKKDENSDYPVQMHYAIRDILVAYGADTYIRRDSMVFTRTQTGMNVEHYWLAPLKIAWHSMGDESMIFKIERERKASGCVIAMDVRYSVKGITFEAAINKDGHKVKEIKHESTNLLEAKLVGKPEPATPVGADVAAKKVTSTKCDSTDTKIVTLKSKAISTQQASTANKLKTGTQITNEKTVIPQTSELFGDLFGANVRVRHTFTINQTATVASLVRKRVTLYQSTCTTVKGYIACGGPYPIREIGTATTSSLKIPVTDDPFRVWALYSGNAFERLVYQQMDQLIRDVFDRRLHADVEYAMNYVDMAWGDPFMLRVPACRGPWEYDEFYALPFGKILPRAPCAKRRGLAEPMKRRFKDADNEWSEQIQHDGLVNNHGILAREIDELPIITNTPLGFIYTGRVGGFKYQTDSTFENEQWTITTTHTLDTDKTVTLRQTIPRTWRQIIDGNFSLWLPPSWFGVMDNLMRNGQLISNKGTDFMTFDVIHTNQNQRLRILNRVCRQTLNLCGANMQLQPIIKRVGVPSSLITSLTALANSGKRLESTILTALADGYRSTTFFLNSDMLSLREQENLKDEIFNAVTVDLASYKVHLGINRGLKWRWMQYQASWMTMNKAPGINPVTKKFSWGLVLEHAFVALDLYCARWYQWPSLIMNFFGIDEPGRELYSRSWKNSFLWLNRLIWSIPLFNTMYEILSPLKRVHQLSAKLEEHAAQVPTHSMIGMLSNTLAVTSASAGFDILPYLRKADDNIERTCDSVKKYIEIFDWSNAALAGPRKAERMTKNAGRAVYEFVKKRTIRTTEVAFMNTFVKLPKIELRFPDTPIMLDSTILATMPMEANEWIAENDGSLKKKLLRALRRTSTVNQFYERWIRVLTPEEYGILPRRHLNNMLFPQLPPERYDLLTNSYKNTRKRLFSWHALTVGFVRTLYDFTSTSAESAFIASLLARCIVGLESWVQRFNKLVWFGAAVYTASQLLTVFSHVAQPILLKQEKAKHEQWVLHAHTANCPNMNPINRVVMGAGSHAPEYFTTPTATVVRVRQTADLESQVIGKVSGSLKIPSGPTLSNVETHFANQASIVTAMVERDLKLQYQHKMYTTRNKMMQNRVREIMSPIARKIRAQVENKRLLRDRLLIAEPSGHLLGKTPETSAVPGVDVYISDEVYGWLDHVKASDNGKYKSAVREILKQTGNREQYRNLLGEFRDGKIRAKAFAKVEVSLRPLSKAFKPRVIKFLQVDVMIHLAPHAYNCYKILKEHFSDPETDFCIITAGNTPEALGAKMQKCIDKVTHGRPGELLENFRMMVNGDDNVCVVSRQMFNSAEFQEKYRDWGRDPTIYIRSDIHMCNYCSGGFFQHGKELRFMLRWAKQTIKFPHFILNRDMDKMYKELGAREFYQCNEFRYLYWCKALSYFLNFSGCPFAEPIARAHIQVSGFGFPKSFEEMRKVVVENRKDAEYTTNITFRQYERSATTDEQYWQTYERYYGQSRETLIKLRDRLVNDILKHECRPFLVEDEEYQTLYECFQVETDAKYGNSVSSSGHSEYVVIECDAGSYDSSTQRPAHEQNIWFQRKCFGDSLFVKAIDWRKNIVIEARGINCSASWRTKYQMLSGYYDTTIGNCITNMSEMLSSLVWSYPTYH